VPDHKWGEAVKAVVILKDGENSTPDEIINFCKERLAAYKRPKSVDFITKDEVERMIEERLKDVSV
jgi:long-chain acyl-CoA synthetase